MPIFNGINPQGFDLSMDFTLTSPKTVDLYDLSGDGSKFFVTVIGKYNDAVNLAPNTDCSCNFFPHTYSAYKIEALKREMDSLADSLFSYMDIATVPDVSFVMSSEPGSVDNSEKFRISQGDQNVSFLPSGVNIHGTGISYEMSSFIFYNLMDTGGRFYQKMDIPTEVINWRYSSAFWNISRMGYLTVAPQNHNPIFTITYGSRGSITSTEGFGIMINKVYSGDFYVKIKITYTGVGTDSGKLCGLIAGSSSASVSDWDSLNVDSDTGWNVRHINMSSKYTVYGHGTHDGQDDNDEFYVMIERKIHSGTANQMRSWSNTNGSYTSGSSHGYTNGSNYFTCSDNVLLGLFYYLDSTSENGVKKFEIVEG